ncbi:MAG: hypothetical protein M3280_09550 [Actinomycetota bacterium]|nr:hypothetical protein [Actinomycetota bacterium]
MTNRPSQSESSVVTINGPRLGAVMLVVALALAACDGVDFQQGRDDAAATGETGTLDENGGEAGAEDGDDAPGGDDAGPGEGEAGDGATFNLIASPDNGSCSYIPNGHLSGADLLNVHFFFLIIGGNPEDVGQLLSVRGSSDTGLSSGHNSAPNNQAQTVAQFALRPSDFGRSHSIAISVDAENAVSETNESDNRVQVSVSLPSPRPSGTIDPLSCSFSNG